MKSISLIAPLLLAGCACKPIIVREPYEVKVPVPVPCLDKPIDKPQWVLDNTDLHDKSLFDKGLALLQELEQRRAYEREIEAVMTSCLKKP